MTRLLVTVCGGCVCGLGVAAAIGFTLLLFAPDLPSLEF